VLRASPRTTLSFSLLQLARTVNEAEHMTSRATQSVRASCASRAGVSRFLLIYNETACEMAPHVRPQRMLTKTDLNNRSGRTTGEGWPPRLAAYSAIICTNVHHTACAALLSACAVRRYATGREFDPPISPANRQPPDRTGRASCSRRTCTLPTTVVTFAY
jgi:hypothetical protein